MGNYQVLFSGEVTQQANEDAVRDNLARRLGIDDRKAKQLFSGRTVVIKSQLNHDDALLLQQELGEFGAICRVKDLTPKDTNVADFRVDKHNKQEVEASLRDITAAHRECPRCGHMQLEASHCARCGVDIAAATRQKHKEDLIIEKKIRELRSQSESANPMASMSPGAKHMEQVRTGSDTAGASRKRGGVMGWFKKSS
jgi:ribosomal protein L37E